jgi:hypothetical protein
VSAAGFVLVPCALLSSVFCGAMQCACRCNAWYKSCKALLACAPTVLVPPAVPQHIPAQCPCCVEVFYVPTLRLKLLPDMACGPLLTGASPDAVAHRFLHLLLLCSSVRYVRFMWFYGLEII